MNRLIAILTIVCSAPMVADALTINIGVGNKVHTGEVVMDGCEKGDGKVGEDKRSLGPFSMVKVEGAFEVELFCGDPSVTVIGDGNILEKILTRVEDGVLHISSYGAICTENPLIVKLSSPEISGIEVSGSSEVNMRCARHLDAMTLRLGGASEVKVEGSVDDLQLDITDAAEFYGYSFRAKTARVQADGSADAEVWASEEISGESRAASTVNFRGGPHSVKVEAFDAADFGADE